MTTKRTTLACAAILAPGLAAAGVPGLNELIGDLPDGKAIIITHAVTIGPGASGDISSQGTVTGDNFPAALTDDPDTVALMDPTVTPVFVNSPPVLKDLSVTLDEDVDFSFSLALFEGSFEDADGDQLQVLRILALPTKGGLTVGGAPLTVVPTDIPRANVGSLVYEPNENENGSDQFAWNASDGAAYADVPALGLLTINPVNDPPVAGPDFVDRFETSSLKIPVASLLANDSDPENNTPLTIIGTTSGSGAVVTVSGGVVFYNANGHVGPDTFSYTLRDSLGETSAGTVRVGIFDDTAKSLNIQVSVDPSSGDATVSGVGIPGRVYRVQAADTGIPNWFDLPGGTVIAGPNGTFSYTDPGPLPPTRVYRTVHP